MLTDSEIDSEYNIYECFVFSVIDYLAVKTVNELVSWLVVASDFLNILSQYFLCLTSIYQNHHIPTSAHSLIAFILTTVNV